MVIYHRPWREIRYGNGSGQHLYYGNYVNNGVTDFYKSNVIITGDLTSPSTPHCKIGMLLWRKYYWDLQHEMIKVL
jgi:hypothetical protein